METKVKNRGWVKNVAIIFLAIMLILTFFSNTIMNRSLPEVATKNIQSGTITAKIRGTGTVSANSNYEVQTDQSRKIKTVLVKAGQEVKAGDILFVFSEADSAELEEAKETLKSLQKSYKLALINASDADYAQQNRDIQQAREDLKEAEEARDKIVVNEGDLDAANDNLNAAKSDVTYSQHLVDEAENELKKMEEYAEANSQVKALEETLKVKEANLDSKQEERDKQQDAVRDVEKTLSAAQMLYGMEYEEMLNAACRRLVYQLEYEENEIKGISAKDLRYLKGLRRDSQELKDYVEKYYLPYAYADLLSGDQYDSTDTIYDAETGQERVISSTNPIGVFWPYQPEGEQFPGDSRVPADSDYSAYYDEDKANEYASAYKEVVTKKGLVDEARSGLDAIDEEIAKMEDEISEINRNIRTLRRTDSTYDSYLTELERAKERLEAAKKNETEAQASVDLIKEKLSEYEAAVKAVKTQEKLLEDLLFSLQQQQKADNKTAQREYLDIQEIQENIAKQEKLIEELTTDSTAKEIVADVGGVVQSVSITAGQTTTPKQTLATIEIPDMGYTMSFSVTNEQARRVHIGDTGSISNYYWGSEITAELTGIKTDPQNPQTSKILTFDVRGDVSVGQSLTISVGARSAEYDYIVPNSALRSDSNGDFILVVIAQNSPLGNKYIATRVDVTIIASDDTNTAITGAVERNDFVITTSTKPISNGDRVRMADSLNAA